MVLVCPAPGGGRADGPGDAPGSRSGRLSAARAWQGAGKDGEPRAQEAQVRRGRAVPAAGPGSREAGCSRAGAAGSGGGRAGSAPQRRDGDPPPDAGRDHGLAAAHAVPGQDVRARRGTVRPACSRQPWSGEQRPPLQAIFTRGSLQRCRSAAPSLLSRKIFIPGQRRRTGIQCRVPLSPFGSERGVGWNEPESGRTATSRRARAGYAR